MARWLIIAGSLLILGGILIHFAPWLFTWFGRLPGDIRIQSDRTQVFVPVTSMIILSIAFTIVINLIRRLL